jgi:small-conductance mechanosensitive channel
MNECDMYLDTVDVIEGRIEDDTKFPIVKNTKIKQICRMVLEFLKIIIYYLKNTINAPKEKQ